MKKISTRFALLMAAAAVLPLLAFGAVSIVSLRGGTKEAVKDGNRNVASRAAKQIDDYVLNSVRILRGAAGYLSHTGLARWQQERILKNIALDNPEFTEITLMSAGGSPLVTSRIGSATVTVPADGSRIQDVLVSGFSMDNAGLPTATLAIPLSQAEGGWLVARVALEQLWRMVDDIRVADSGYALVITKEGQLLAHGDPDLKSLVAQGRQMLNHPLLSAVRSSRASDDEYEDWAVDDQTTPNRGQILGTSAEVSSLGWLVIVEQPTVEAYANPNRLQRQLFISIAVALLAMLTVGYFFGRSFIDPILRLTRGTRALAEGRLDERVAVGTKDELGQLGTAFNNMADRLVELQDNIKKQERQAMFGRVSIGLVHDLSTPIQNIGNACKMIVMLFDDLEYRETFKRTVDRELVQIKRMLDDLRNVAKPTPLEKVPLDVNKALQETIESMQGGAGSSGLTLESSLCFGPLYMEGDRYALNRVFGNLIKNAFQATPPQGKVTVSTLRQDHHAVIEVADTGSGIPADRLATIFDDFVTTKKRGLGLGLAISKKIVEQLGGTISVTSEVGQGTRFTMRFPLTAARPEQLAAG